jgi:iron complex outermembrane receptor protein
MKTEAAKRLSRLLTSASVGAIMLVTGPVAFAQTADETAQDETNRRLDTIIVESTKRDTTLQDAPISIGVVTGETISEYAITDLTDLQGFMPSLVVQKTFGNWAVRVRGLGSGVTNIAFDSSVSIFNDGIYCGRSRCLEGGFFDTGSVEIARGPQGALFGKSTIAGAITLSSARPTAEFEAYGTVGLELEDGGYTFNGAVSGPLSDKVRGRLAIQFKDLDGTFDNGFSGDEEGATESLALRGSLEWDITENTELWFKVETASVDLTGNTNQLVSAGALASPNAPINRANLETNLNDVRFVSTGVGIEDFDSSDQLAVSGQLTHRLDNDGTLNVIAGIWNLDYTNFLDVDGVPEALLNTTLNEEYEQKSFEVRYLSPSGGAFEYIVGAMYHDSLTKTGQFSAFFPGFYQSVGVPAVATASIPGATGVNRRFKRASNTVSVYGQLTWNATENLTVIADLRYTEEEQDALGYALPITLPDRINPVYTANAPFQAGSPEYRFFQVRKDESLDPSIRAIYAVNDDINIYAAFSTGSKPGGLKANDGALGAILLSKDAAFLQEFTGSSTLTRAQMAQGVTLKQGNTVFDFEDETAENFEIGTKMLLADGTISFNAAAFIMNFDNLQTSSYDGTRFIIGNAATAEVQGVEFDAQWQATDSLRLTASGAFLDATYGEYKNAQCPIGANGQREDPTCVDGQGDLSGRRLERTPEVEFNLGAAYDRPITDTLFLSANVDMYYSGDFFVRQDFDPNGFQDSFTKWNGRVAVGPEAGGWQVALIGRNLTDERTIQHAYEVLSDFVALGSGRSIMLETTIRW